MINLETLKAEAQERYMKYRASEDETRRLLHEWSETYTRVQTLEREAEVERIVAERLAGK